MKAHNTCYKAENVTAYTETALKGLGDAGSEQWPNVFDICVVMQGPNSAQSFM